MTFDTFFLLLTVGAFSSLFIVLFVVSVWSNLPAKASKSTAAVTPAVRPAETASAPVGLEHAA